MALGEGKLLIGFGSLVLSHNDNSFRSGRHNRYRTSYLSVIAFISLMSTNTSFALRPLERNPLSAAGNALEGAFRVHLTQKEQKGLALANGDLVRLKTASGFKGYAVAWAATQTNPGNKAIAKVTDLLREQYSLSLNDPIFIEKATDAWRPLKSVEISFPDSPELLSKYSSTDELLYWARYALVDLEIILPECSFPVQQKGPRAQQKTSKLRLTITNIDPLPNEKHAVYFDPVKTRIVPASNVPQLGTLKSSPDSGRMQLNRDGIGGLTGHIATIDRTLSFLADAATSLQDQYLLGPTTLLLHGPEGTGKTLLLESLAKCPWQEVYRVDLEKFPKGQVKAVSEIFEAAQDNQPCLVLMDNLDRFLDKADTLVNRLRTELAKLEGSQIVVAAAARSIYDVDTSLRTTSTFKTELELFPPNLRQREDILRQILGPARKLENIDFPTLAANTHGFVGRDIHKLCGLARNRRVQRAYESLDEDQKATLGEILDKTEFVAQEDFDAVIDQVQPTVLKESILEVPKVRWTDIAGLDHVRALLEAITIRPFRVSYSQHILTIILNVTSTRIWTSSLVGHRHVRECYSTGRQAAQRH